MNDRKNNCECVIDCYGLYEIATTKSNSIRAACLDGLASGTIGVPTCVWQEFESAYADEATTLAKHVAQKIRMKTSYQVKAASIAEKLNSHLLISPYNQQTDLYVASISAVEGYTILTTSKQLSQYQKMECKSVSELKDWTSTADT